MNRYKVTTEMTFTVRALDEEDARDKAALALHEIRENEFLSDVSDYYEVEEVDD